MDLAAATVHKSGNSLHVTHGDDKELYVEFHMEAEHQGFKSEQEGRPIFEDKPFIKIMFPGDRTKTVYRAVTDADKERFPKQWAAFEKGQEQGHTGTPITEWPPVSKSQAMELKGLNIHTVEQLAAVTDTNLASFLGARDLRDKAKAWIDKAKDNAVVSQLQAQNAALKADFDALKLQMAELIKKTKKAAD